MSKFKHVFTGIIGFALIFSSNVFADEAKSEQSVPGVPELRAMVDNPKQRAVIDKLTTAFMRENKVPGVAIQIFVNGEPASYYYGYANVAEKVAVSDTTIFEIGSISKIMTGLLLAQEIDFNKMALTDSVQKYMQNLPEEKYANVTLQKLATHTSGLPFEAPRKVSTPEELASFLTQWAPADAPSEEWHYSNVGIGMIGYILEGTYERPYERIYRSHISWPLGMKPVAFNVPDSLKPDHAQGYDAKGNAVPQMPIGVLPAASSLRMTAIDMQRFLSAAIGLPGTPERIFYPMRMTQSTYIKLPTRYEGFGWQIYPLDKHSKGSLIADAKSFNFAPQPVKEVLEKPLYNGNSLMDKTGTTRGFRCYIAVIPNRKSGIAILTNKGLKDGEIVVLGRQILFALTKEPVKS